MSATEDNTPVELYGPDDGGWYTTRVYDWIALCPDLRDADVRGYLILRSLVIEKYKNPIRKLSVADLCELIPNPSDGGSSSLSRVRSILAGLSAVGLVTTPEGGPVRTSSRASAAVKPIRVRINDMPAGGYLGWRNTETKLSSIACRSSPTCGDEAGRKSDPGGDQGDSGDDPGRISDPAGSKSDPRGSISDPDPAPDQEKLELPLVPTLGTDTGGEALAARSAGDGRRPSDGSSACANEGGSAASSTDQPGPSQEQGGAKAGGARHTRQQLEQAQQVCAYFPAELGVRLVPDLTQTILDAMAGDVPAADRTVAQLGQRIERRWNHHGYASKFHAGELHSAVGAAIAMVRPLRGGDRYGCANPRCEDGADVDTGQPCGTCPERIAARKAARRQGAPVPSQRPATAQGAACVCGSPITDPDADSMCPECQVAAAALQSSLAPF